MRGRVEERQTLLGSVTSREPVDGGVRCVFGGTVPIDELMRLAVAEQACCRFFVITITVDSDGTTLEVRAPIDARPIVESLFGVVR